MTLGAAVVVGVFIVVDAGLSDTDIVVVDEELNLPMFTSSLVPLQDVTVANP